MEQKGRKVSAGTRKTLVADIGGSNARFAIADPLTLALEDLVSLPSASFSSLQDAARTYLASTRARPSRACFAIAAPLAGDTIRMTNRPWSFTREELREACGVAELDLVNDFEALARAVPRLAAADLHRVGGHEASEKATRLVLGPGTGLGLSALVPAGNGWIPVPGEGGHASLPVRNARELAIRDRFGGSGNHVSVEDLVSGPGLARLYRILAEMGGRKVETLPPEYVTAAGLAGDDPIAVEAMAQFVEWLGRFAGDMALAFAARGGVYLAGGIAPQILPALESGPFRSAFEKKGRLSPFLAAIPVYVIIAGDAGLRGAALSIRGG